MEDDNEPIGIILATDRDEIMVEYATGSISNQLFVSRYQLYLPDVEVLKAELRRLLESGDGDNIGDVIDFYLLSGNLKEASKFSFQVKSALENIAILARDEIKASLVYVAGDDICFTVSDNLKIMDILTSYSEYFLEKTGRTMSFGIGRTSVEALVSLRTAKVSGKGRVVAFGDYQS